MYLYAAFHQERLNMSNHSDTKKEWQSPELEKFNKMDLVKGGAAPFSLESGVCYKTGS